MKLEQSKFCPLIKDNCKELGCSWFTQLRGRHPQTGESIDEWGCAMTWLPVLMIENTKEATGVSASIDSFRNEMVRGQRAVLQAAESGEIKEITGR